MVVEVKYSTKTHQVAMILFHKGQQFSEGRRLYASQSTKRDTTTFDTILSIHST